MTFALYLFQYPLVLLLSVYPLGEPTSWIQRIWLVTRRHLLAGHRDIWAICANNQRVLTNDGSYFGANSRLALLVKVARNAP